MIDLTDKDRQTILDELVQFSALRGPNEGDFSAMDYQARLQALKGITISKEGARNRLAALVRQGLLVTDLVLYEDGYVRRVWYKPENMGRAEWSQRLMSLCESEESVDETNEDGPAR